MRRNSTKAAARHGSRLAWVMGHCKFAQDQQQLMLPFHDEAEYTTNPADVVPGLPDFAPEGADQEDWVAGFFHVTTNLPAVLSSGELRSRGQLGGAAVGLGGGWQDVARDKVSVTHSRQKAEALAEAMRFAADVAHGLSRPSVILWSLMEAHGAPDEVSKDFSPNLYRVLRGLGAPRGLLGEDPEDGLEAWLDANVRGGQAHYEFMQSVEEAIFADAERNSEFGSEPGVYSGFTMPFESFARISPRSVGIVEVMVRRDAVPEHVPGEVELRFYPRDVMLLQGRTPVVQRAPGAQSQAPA